MADDLPTNELTSREPTVEDLRDLCRELNQRAANYNRRTMDVDLIVASDLENEAKVFGALSTLPDNAVRELQPGELQKYNVIRVGDEILVDLMVSAGGINYSEAAKDVVVREVDGVPIPFASPRLLWRMKVVTHREKDAGDLVFLRHWFAERGEQPPVV
jgi:hypothetical protein